MNDPRLLQPLVAAENCGCESASAELVNPPVAADRQTGSPAPVESPQCLEALVAALRERWERRLAECRGFTRSAFDGGRIYQLRECLDELISEIESAATGGN